MSTHAPRPWVVEEQETVLDCGIFTVERRLSRLEGGEKEATFYALQSKDWVNVVPVTVEGQLILVEQFRHGTGRVSLETPAGLVEADESPIDAALRELREEAGYSGRARILGAVDANPAFLTNRFSTVVVEEAVLSDPTAWDEHEELRVHLVPVGELPALLRGGKIRNAYSVLALSWFLLGYGPAA